MPIEPPDPLRFLVQMLRLAEGELRVLAEQHADKPLVAEALSDLQSAVAKLSRALEANPPSR